MYRDKNKFYDFICNEEGIPVIRTFNAAVKTDENGKSRLVQTSDFVYGYAEDKCEAIRALRHNGYFSWDQTVGTQITVKTDNIFTKLNLDILSRRSALLNKVYDDKTVVDGMNAIASYIYYIDVETGIEYVMCVGTESFSESKVAELENEGFANIEGTILKDFISILTYDGKPVQVKAKPRERQ